MIGDELTILMQREFNAGICRMLNYDMIVDNVDNFVDACDLEAEMLMNSGIWQNVEMWIICG